MPHGQHNEPSTTVRLATDLRNWLSDYAGRIGRPRNAIVTDALREYRERHDQTKQTEEQQ